MPGDTRAWREVRARVAAIGRRHVRAGVVGAAASAAHGDSGATNGEIAAYNEFGTRTVPSRSFVRATFRDPARLAELRALHVRLLGLVVEGRMSLDQALGLIGAWSVGAIRATIAGGDFAPLAPSTVARKRSSKPLVDTGQLAGAVSWVVVP